MFEDQDEAGAQRMKVERDAELIQLAQAAPMRKPVAQDDVDGLALFDVARSPTLL